MRKLFDNNFDTTNVTLANDELNDLLNFTTNSIEAGLNNDKGAANKGLNSLKKIFKLIIATF